MGVFDKIKNALFEEEYVEVEEKPKTKQKKDTKKPKKDVREVKIHDNKPIAKKIVLPSKTEEIEEDFDNYKPEEEDFDIRPEKDGTGDTSEFRFPAVNDEDFDNKSFDNEPKIVGVVKEEDIQPIENETSYQGYQNEVDTHQTVPSTLENAYHGHENKLYHSDYNDTVPVYEYGTYEKEKKPVFKPSPIISPIYGVLDKNYKKEEIVSKREVRLSSYTREHMNVDDVRRKAYGNLSDDIALDMDGKSELSPEYQESESVGEETDNLLVDLSNDNDKPQVSEVTVGDAEEYFRDLGLEYNIDYKDSSKEKATGRRVSKDYDEEEKKNPITDSEMTTSVVDKATADPTNDDNLFDLIDSMYEEKE